MNILAGSLLVTLLSSGALAQTPADKPDPKPAPDIEIVKFEVSVRRSPNLDASPMPRADMGSVAQRQVDQNISGPAQDNMGIKNNTPNTGSNKGMDRQPTDTTTPHYDRYGNEVRGSDAYWPTSKEDVSSPYDFFASLTLKNSGQKSIKGVYWDYVLTDPKTAKEIKRHRFHAKKSIKAGESVTLTELIKPSGAKRRVEITRIDYVDGSTWQPSEAQQSARQ